MPDAMKGFDAMHRRGRWPLVSAAEMQALDRHTIDVLGVPGEILMESAGRALVESALELLRESERPSRPIRAFCGAGNNGGDGFVLVRHLIGEGFAAEAVLLGDPDRLPADAAANWARLESIGAARRVLDPNAASDGGRDAPGVTRLESTRETPTEIGALLADTSVVVDALFGTGLAREITGGHARVIEAVSAARDSGLRVLSVDIPSGIDADTGQILGVAIEADRTITISLPKIGLALEPGRRYAGDVRVARVGIADPDPERAPRVELWNARAAAARLPARPSAGHKGSFGHVLVVAGSGGKTGAAALACRAAARAGAGLVTLAHPQGLEPELMALPAEVMSAPVAATADGRFARTGEKAIEELVSTRDVVALGPGIGLDAETVALVERLAPRIERPLVIDADGLNALVGRLELLHDRRAPVVLTPHPGEASRLLESSASALNADRVGSARALAERSRAIVVLKGARTVIADPQGRALVVPTGGPVLATGGTGDVLTGIVAALLATDLEPFEAAGLAAWWHGATADRLPASALGFGMLAGELADALPRAAAEIMARAGEGAEGESLDLRFPGP